MEGERRKEEQELKLELREFIADNKQWRQHTDDYRKGLCDKVDSINLKIEMMTQRHYELPCKEQKTILEGIRLHINWLWLLVSGCILAIIGAFFKGR